MIDIDCGKHLVEFGVFSAFWAGFMSIFSRLHCILHQMYIVYCIYLFTLVSITIDTIQVVIQKNNFSCNMLLSNILSRKNLHCTDKQENMQYTPYNYLQAQMTSKCMKQVQNNQIKPMDIIELMLINSKQRTCNVQYNGHYSQKIKYHIACLSVVQNES